MKLLPLKNVVFHTRLSPAECVACLQDNTTPWCLDHMFRRDPEGRPFVGVVGVDSFRIRHIIGYNNSFLPIAHGELKPIESGTEVAVNFRPHPYAMRFAYIGIAIFLLLFGGLIFIGLHYGFDKEMLVLPVMLVVVTTVIHTSVKAEYENSKELLKNILKSPEC
jgi:hypothetical protein